MSQFGFHPRRAWRALWAHDASSAAAPRPSVHDLKAVNVAFVDGLKAAMPHDEAMEYAIGAGFEEFGGIELAILRHYGLAPDQTLVDVGCGSGRLAQPLAGYLKGAYLGIDLVPDLVAHARKVAARPDWRFEVIDHIEIPQADATADMVCFFSVLTHLLHEQSYWYLEEARRVLNPGGKIVFSFLEFREPGHLPVFWATLNAARARMQAPMNVFLDRDAITVWARELGLEIEDLKFGSEQIVPEGVLGQSVCVLRKPL